MALRSIAGLLAQQVGGGAPTPPPTSADHVTQDGVTFNFSEVRPVGQYCTGDWWVQGPVTITSITPESRALGASEWYFTPATCTLDAANNRVVVSSTGQPYLNNTPIQFTIINGTSGISVNTTYYVVNRTSSYFQLSLTSGGAPISFTTNGSGTFRVNGVAGRVVHGAMVNPGNRSYVGGNVADNDQGVPFHGYDNLDEAAAAAIARQTGVDLPYDGSLNQDPGITGNPLVFGEGEEGTIVKFLSIEKGVSWLFQLAYADYLVPLTVVKDVPAANSWRPGVAGSSKAMPATTDMLNLGVFQQLPPVGPIPNVDELALKLRRMHNCQFTEALRIRHIVGQNNQRVYGRDIAQYISDAAVMLDLNISDADKKKLLIGLVQIGIDSGSRCQEGGIYPATGGGCHWHKFPVVCAIASLSVVPEIVAYSDYLPLELGVFCEDTQIIQVNYKNVNSRGYLNNSDPARPYRGYEEFEVGECDWNIQPFNLTALGDNWDTSYRTAVSYSSIGFILSAALSPEMRMLWQNEGAFEYYDRAQMMIYSPLGIGTTNAIFPNLPSVFVIDMLNAYWNETGNGVPAVNGAFIRDSRLWVSFDKQLDFISVPSASDFTVTVNGSPATVLSIADPSASFPSNPTAPSRSPYVIMHKVALTLSAPISAGDVVTVSYTAGAKPIRSIEGVNIANISSLSVTNLAGVMNNDATTKTRVDNTATAWSNIVEPYPAFSAQKMGIAFSMSVDTVGTPYFGTATSTGPFRCFNSNGGAGGNFRFTMPGIVFIGAGGALTTGDHLILIEVDTTQASIAAGGVRVYVDGVEIADGGSSTYTPDLIFTMRSMLSGGGSSDLALLRAVQIADGKMEFFWLDIRTGAQASFGFDNPAVRAAFTTAGNAIGDNGEGPTGSPPLFFYAGTTAQYNSGEGVPNSGTWFGSYLTKRAGTYN